MLIGYQGSSGENLPVLFFFFFGEREISSCPTTQPLFSAVNGGERTVSTPEDDAGRSIDSKLVKSFHMSLQNNPVHCKQHHRCGDLIYSLNSLI